MKVKIDFSIDRFFGVVEQMIFRLVLNGLRNVKQIKQLLWLFSDEVIANALIRLVNKQVLRIDLETQELSLSDAIGAIIEMCNKTTYDIEIPLSLADMMADGHLLISDSNTNDEILSLLLPNIKLSFLAKSLDFSISRRGETDEF